MSKRSLLVAFALALSLVAAAVAAPSAQARTFYLYSNSFSPSYADEGSGVRVRFFNVDSLPHRIVAYSTYGSKAWTLDVTLQPWQGYTLPQPLYCVYPSCGYNDLYLFREVDRSSLSMDSGGTARCQGYCGELWVHL